MYVLTLQTLHGGEPTNNTKENCRDSPFEASLLVTASFFDVVCRLATVYVYLTVLPFPLLLPKVLPLPWHYFLLSNVRMNRICTHECLWQGSLLGLASSEETHYFLCCVLSRGKAADIGCVGRSCVTPWIILVLSTVEFDDCLDGACRGHGLSRRQKRSGRWGRVR